MNIGLAMNTDILIITNNPSTYKYMSDMVLAHGFTTRYCADNAYIEMINQRVPTLIIFDSTVPSNNDIPKIKQLNDFCPVMVMIDENLPITHITPLMANSNIVIVAQNASQEIWFTLINRLMDTLQQQLFPDFNIIANSDFNHYLQGHSIAVQELQQNLAQAIGGNSRVLIHGAIGTGKTIAACYIHANSLRKHALVALLPCGNIIEDDIERILFGEEYKTGKVMTIGLLERAHGGTLILDKVELLPLFIQQKMARLLQQNSLQRLAGDKYIKIDTRIIATIGIDTEQAIQDQQVDRDFYQRVSVLEINLPSLAERRTDIIDIARYFNQKWAEIYSTPPLQILKSALNILERYNWQGNLFALNNFIEQLYLRDDTNHSKIVDDRMIDELLYASEGGADNSATANFLLQPFRRAKESFEKYYLRYQLQRYDGNISQTAKMIGMDRVSLHRKIRMLNLVSQQQNSENQE